MTNPRHDDGIPVKREGRRNLDEDRFASLVFRQMDSLSLENRPLSLESQRGLDQLMAWMAETPSQDASTSAQEPALARRPHHHEASAPTLRISRTHFPITALGPGLRLGVWVQGCPLACQGCMARETWAADGGAEVGVDELAERWRRAVRDGATGLTVSGGEPFAQPGALLAFLQAVDQIRATSSGELDILIFTGFEIDELDEQQLHAAEYADVLVTGRYEAGQPTDLRWRGSANQTMVLRTDLGRRRYAAHLRERAKDPEVQVHVDASGVWIVGVPRPGTLAQLERLSRDAAARSGELAPKGRGLSGRD